MISKCEVCGDTFKNTYEMGKISQWQPKVCGGACFATLLLTQKVSYSKWNKWLMQNKDKYYPLVEADASKRSSYERCLARWLVAEEIPYVFEPWVFKPDTGVYYLPDFYIMRVPCFLETKGVWESGAFPTAKAFGEFTPIPYYVLTLPFLKHIKAQPKKEDKLSHV